MEDIHTTEADGSGRAFGWTLSPVEFAATQQRVEKINARASKRGFTGRVEVIGTQREVTTEDAAGLRRTRVVVDAEIHGEAPSYGGWQFLAAVDSIDTATGTDFVLRTAPGVTESGIDRSTLVPGFCAHCNVQRANRRYTYLVRHTETGEAVQVGSTCIKDFTGWQAKPVFLVAEDLEDELRTDAPASGPDLYSPQTVVAIAWAASQTYGWIPASAHTGIPTRSTVSDYLYSRDKAGNEAREEIAPQIEEASTTAKTIITTLLDGLDDDGDYPTNLKTCLRGTYVEPKHMGLVVSAVAAYQRLTTKETTPAEPAQQTPSRYVGTVDEKITLTGTITRLIDIDTTWGTSMLVIIDTGEAVAKMFTSAAWAFDVDENTTLTITGTVKAHEEYRDTKQTVLTRPKRIPTDD